MGRLIRFLGRAGLAAIFVTSGINALRNPGYQAEAAKRELPFAPPRLDVIARVQGGVQLAGGVAMAVGVVPYVAAAALASTLIPVTYVGHPFWKQEDPQQRRQHRVHFLKNLGLFAGLLYVSYAEWQHRSQQG